MEALISLRHSEDSFPSSVLGSGELLPLPLLLLLLLPLLLMMAASAPPVVTSSASILLEAPSLRDGRAREGQAQDLNQVGCFST